MLSQKYDYILRLTDSMPCVMSIYICMYMHSYIFFFWSTSVYIYIYIYIYITATRTLSGSRQTARAPMALSTQKPNKAYAQMAFKAGPDYGKSSKDSEIGTQILCTTHYQGKYIQLYWVKRSEKTIVHGAPLTECYDHGILDGQEWGLHNHYKGPRPTGLHKTLETYTDMEHLFERIAYSWFGPDYTYMLFMPSYGPEHEVPTSPYYKRDNRGPLNVYERSSDMPIDHWYFYRITDNPDKDTPDAINHLGINDWHKATIDQWTASKYTMNGISGQRESWHLKYTPLAVPTADQSASMNPMIDHQQAMQPYDPPSAPVQLNMDVNYATDPAQSDDAPMASTGCCPWSSSPPIDESQRKTPLIGV